jgi:hypothetical protein
MNSWSLFSRLSQTAAFVFSRVPELEEDSCSSRQFGCYCRPNREVRSPPQEFDRDVDRGLEEFIGRGFWIIGRDNAPAQQPP